MDNNVLLDKMAERLTEFADIVTRIQSTEQIHADEEVKAIARSIRTQLVTVAVKMGNNLLPYAQERYDNASRS